MHNKLKNIEYRILAPMTADELGSTLFLRLNFPAKHIHNRTSPHKIATKKAIKMPTPIYFGTTISATSIQSIEWWKSNESKLFSRIELSKRRIVFIFFRYSLTHWPKCDKWNLSAECTVTICYLIVWIQYSVGSRPTYYIYSSILRINKCETTHKMRTPIRKYEFWWEKNLFTYLAYSRKLITRVDFESVWNSIRIGRATGGLHTCVGRTTIINNNNSASIDRGTHTCCSKIKEKPDNVEYISISCSLFTCSE